MPPPELVDDATAEILLRLPPDDPACLFRASLVCKPWRRIASDRAFLRRYRQFHGAPPLLGFIRNRRYGDPCPEFVATTGGASPFCTPEFFDCDSWWALDCRHGRALFRTLDPAGFVVWDPVTDDRHYLPQPDSEYLCNDAAAVLCAVDGCDHLDCHGGPFLVVSVTADEEEDVTMASVYSSQTRAWGTPSCYLDFGSVTTFTPGLLTGDALYFMATLGLGLVKYDLAKRELSVMDTPDDYHYELLGTVMTAEGGGLGLAGVENYSLHLWSWQAGTEEWAKHRVINLLKSLLPVHALQTSPRLIGFMEGSDVVFMNTYAGAFAIKLNSGNVRKIGERGRYYSVLPYSSFYTPDPDEASCHHYEDALIHLLI